MTTMLQSMLRMIPNDERAMNPHIKMISPSPRLSPFVASMWEWDVPDAEVARSITGKLLPSLAPQFAVHYRSAMRSDRGHRLAQYHQIATGLQTQVVTVRATGPVGAIMVRLKPEAASLFLGCALAELRDSQVELRDLFPNPEVVRLIEQLAQAPDTANRVALIEQFLLLRLREDAPDPRMRQAAQQLRKDFTTPVRILAADLHLSERQLLRRFQAVFGTSPKQFARIARVTRMLELRRHGSSWADITQDCGFTDQAHLIRDFSALVQCPPEAFLRSISTQAARPINAVLSGTTCSNTFVV
jgi:AraC-like DNA-binding protein